MQFSTQWFSILPGTESNNHALDKGDGAAVLFVRLGQSLSKTEQYKGVSITEPNISVFFLSACCWQLSCCCLHLAAAFLLQAGFSIMWWGGESVDVVAHFYWNWEPLPFSHGCVCGLGRHSPAIFNVPRLVTDISSSTSAWSTVEAHSGHPGIWPTFQVGFSASWDAASSPWGAGLVLGQAGGHCSTSTPAQHHTPGHQILCVFLH